MANSVSRKPSPVLLSSHLPSLSDLPFIPADLSERFAFPLPWSDPAGKLPLAPKQRQKLVGCTVLFNCVYCGVEVGWCRPEEFIPRPRMIQLVDCYSVKQTVVSDCSFVASIAVSAQYEKRYSKRLITSIIFPQNRAGEPIYNPCGKYMVSKDSLLLCVKI